MAKLIRFDTQSPTEQNYRSFIDTLRDAVVSGKEVHGGFMVLKDPSTLPNSRQRFVFVELSNWGDQSITLGIDITNLYVVGYQTGKESFFFNEYDIKKAPYDTLFENTTAKSLPFGGRYVGSGQLEQNGGLRENIELGIKALDDAIKVLASPSTEQNSKARALIVVIQMVSEAARFRYIEQEVVYGITSDREVFLPNPHVLSLENNWDALSEQIQLAGKDLKFQKPVTLVNEKYEQYQVTEITFSLYADIAVLKYHKTGNQPTLFSRM